MSIMQAVGTPIHQLEDVKGRLIAHALINGVGDAAVASARLQAHAQATSLTPLATAGSKHILCSFGPRIDLPAVAAGLRCALENICAEHAGSTYSFTVHGGPSNLTGENLGSTVVWRKCVRSR